MVTAALIHKWKPWPKGLIFEQKELASGERKRSNYYCCHCCGKTTHAPVMSDRRKLYLCAYCFKSRCDFCEGPTLSTVRSGLRTIRVCRNCDNHPDTFEVVLALLKISKEQKYLDFIEQRDARRQKALDAMNQAIKEETP